jgi:hypothetical protein
LLAASARRQISLPGTVGYTLEQPDRFLQELRTQILPLDTPDRENQQIRPILGVLLI